MRKLSYTYSDTTYNSKPALLVTTSVYDGTAVVSKGNVLTDYLGYTVRTRNIDASANVAREYTYVNDYFGNPLTVTAPDGTTEGYTYDFAGNVLTYTNQLGKTMSYAYDMAGRNISVTDFNGNTTNNTYDDAGRLIIISSPFSDAPGLENTQSKTYYDDSGNVTKESVLTGTSDEGAQYRNVQYSYNNMNRMLYSKTDDTYGMTQYMYDANGNVTNMIIGISMEVADMASIPGTADHISYTYDNLNRCISTSGDMSPAKAMEYDLAGNVTKSSKPASAVTSTYDPFGNVLSITDDSTGNVLASYTYDAAGRRTSMTDESGTTNYIYDGYGNLTTESKNGIIKTTTINNVGNRTSFAITDNGTAILTNTYAYDNAGRMTAVTSNGTTVNYTYDDNGNLLTESDGTSTVNYTYNDANLVTSKVNAMDGTNTDTHTYTGYNLAGEVLSVYDSGANINTSYEYDNVGRLSKETKTGSQAYEMTYDYSITGNQLGSVKVEGETTTETTYSYTMYNRLRQKTIHVNDEIVERKIYSHNENGELTAKRLVSTTEDPYLYNYFYDALGRMKSITKDSEEYASYTYDGDGLRQSKTFDGITITHILDGMNVVAEKTGTSTTTYSRGINLISRTTPDGTDKYFTNIHGDVTALYNPSEITRTTYDAFGITADGDFTDNPFGYTGEYTDAETGFIYLRARYYDPEIARFTTEDPIMDGTNWYVYCGNNPVKFVDPSGTKLCATNSSISFNQASALLEQIKIATGDSGYYLDEEDGVTIRWSENGEIKGGSEVARSLIKAIVNADETIHVNFRKGNNLSGNSDFKNNIVYIGSRENSEELTSTLVHELTHAFTDISGFDDSVITSFTDANDPFVNELTDYVKRQYKEATAITVEEQFRKEMGYKSRAEVTNKLIGVNNYGQFPYELTHTPAQIYKPKDMPGEINLYGRVSSAVLYSRGPGIIDYLKLNY